MTIERSLAVKALIEITRDGGYNNIVLKRTLERGEKLSRSQKAFVTETVNGTLRNIIYIDWLINSVSRLECAKMKPFVLNNLRAAVYQLFFLSAPDYAVCNEAVGLARDNGYEALAGFINGVLRNLIRGRDKIKLPNAKDNPLDYLSVKYSCPEWLCAHFISELGFDETERLLGASLLPVKVHVAVNTLKTNADELFALLEEEGVTAEKTSLANILKLSSSSDMTRLASYKNGLFHVIDPGSYLAALALEAEEGNTVLDICAAPGGKSLAIAQLMNNTGRIDARDIHNHKLELLRLSAKRMGISCIETREADAKRLDEGSIAKFDSVLVDAPCSGLGLIRKKPDIKLTKTKADIKKLATIQRGILTSAAEYVKPGGTLLYCTCTLARDENEKNALWFADNFDFEIDSLSGFAKNHGLPDEAVNGGFIRILPRYLDSDGFFVAKLKAKRN